MSPKVPLVDLAAVHAELGEELEEAVLRVCRSQRFIGGSEVVRFEEEFAAAIGARFAVGVGNGTDALELVLRALRLDSGAEVLVPANTFIATAEAVAAAGARPRFVDVDKASGLIDLRSCEARISARTAAIVPVHLYGRIAPMDDLAELAERHGLHLIEDAAQAHGARLGERHAGTFGVAGVFSFYPGKNLGAFGDAGAVVTNDVEIADRIRLLRDHGRRGRDHHELVGVNSRLDAIQAAVLRIKLPRLGTWTEARGAVANVYRDRLADHLLDWRPASPEAESHHLFPILIEDRDQLAEHLAAEGIGTGVHYRAAITSTPAFAELADPCPDAEARAETQLSLPIHPYLTQRETERIATLVNAFAAERRPVQISASSR